VWKQPETSTTTERSLDGIRVLIIEDQWEARIAMQRICEKHGAKVALADSAQEALDQLQHSDFDLILSDIGMPNMDGYEFIRAWRAEETRRGLKRVPAIALTAYATPKDRSIALNAGFTNHIAKPVNKENLFALIRTLGVHK
jgi:CheY-like chemotaxis protein